MGLFCIPLTLLTYIEPFRFDSFLSKMIYTSTALTGSLRFIHPLVKSPFIKFAAEWGLPLSAAILGEPIRIWAPPGVSDTPLASQHFLFVVVYSLSCVWLFCDLMDCSLPGSSVHGISQARILEWVAVSFSRGSSRPRDQTLISCIGRWIYFHWATWEGSTVYGSR